MGYLNFATQLKSELYGGSAFKVFEFWQQDAEARQSCAVILKNDRVLIGVSCKGRTVDA